MSSTKVVNRWEAPRGFVAIENVGKLDCCDCCKAYHVEGDPDFCEYEVCNFHANNAKCHPSFRTDGKNATLREANKHYFLHTGGGEAPKWLLNLADENPNWRLYCWYDDDTCDMDDTDYKAVWRNTLALNRCTPWSRVRYFQIIPIDA